MSKQRVFRQKMLCASSDAGKELGVAREGQGCWMVMRWKTVIFKRWMRVNDYTIRRAFISMLNLMGNYFKHGTHMI